MGVAPKATPREETLGFIPASPGLNGPLLSTRSTNGPLVGTVTLGLCPWDLRPHNPRLCTRAHVGLPAHACGVLGPV